MNITLFKSVQEAYTWPETIIDCSWQQAAELFCTHNPSPTKESVPLFNLWQFRTEDAEPGRRRIWRDGQPTEEYQYIPGTIRRCRANVLGVWGIVLDYDQNTTIQAVYEQLQDFEHVLYTTYRHTAEHHKFRVILPFTRMWTRDELIQRRASIAATFTGVDHASFSESQSFYLHSGPEPGCYHNTGYFLEPDWFDQVVPEVKTAPVITTDHEFTDQQQRVYQERMIRSLMTCHGLHYANDQSHLGVLTLVSLCKSAGISFAGYDQICEYIAAPDSSLKQAATRAQAWRDWQPYSGITAEVRERWISSYGGISEFPDPALRQIRTAEQMTEFIKNKYAKKENQ